MGFPITFNERHETKVHIAQVIMTIFVISFSIARMTISNPPPRRSNAVGITLGFKSLIVIAYQLLTAHVRSFQKWASLKANAVLNCLECVFWFAVIVVTGMGLTGSFGAAAAMSALTMILAIILEFVSIWTAVVSVRQHRRNKYGPKDYGGSARGPAVV